MSRAIYPFTAKCCDFEQGQILKRGHELGEFISRPVPANRGKRDRIFLGPDYLQGKLGERQAAKCEDSTHFHGMLLTGQDGGTVKREGCATGPCAFRYNCGFSAKRSTVWNSKKALIPGLSNATGIRAGRPQAISGLEQWGLRVIKHLHTALCCRRPT